MKRFLVASTLLKSFTCLLLAGGGLFAQDAKHPEKPLLWKVDGKGLERPSYLFGTIHLGAEEVTTLHPEARKAFESADAVYTEVPMDAASQLAAAPMMMRKDGQALNDALGEEISARLDEELKLINPALDSTAFQPLATWVVGMSLPLLPDQLAGRKALDIVLWEEAAAAGKKTGAIETLASQLAIFTEMA
ncbi:MAG: TraB/GumN family protein, partial [Verrucomicrobia bacterium]|nr:TraB/GumN family protein [Verrucomicrobiota bacterium]